MLYERRRGGPSSTCRRASSRRLAKRQRHRQNHRHQFDAGVLLADSGIRHVVHADPEAIHIIEAIVEFCALTKLRMRPEIDTSAGFEVSDRDIRRRDESLEEIDVEAETAITIEGAFGGAEGADERRD